MSFTVVHTITPKAGLIGMAAAMLASVKKRVHIFTGQVWYTKSGFLRRLLIVLDVLVVKLATHILIDGNAQRSFLIENGIVKPKNSTVLGKGSISGVDINRFFPNPSVGREIRANLGFNPSDIVFLFLGRLNIDKGLLDLAKAYKQVKTKYNNIRLLLVGYDEEEMIEKINEILSPGCYVYIGPTSEPEHFLQACDVFCLPSYREAFGLSVIEASACGKAILCSNTYGLQETIIDDVTGLRHVTKDIDSIYKQMETLILNPEYRNLLGLNGVKYVREHFRSEIISAEWLKYYYKLLK